MIQDDATCLAPHHITWWGVGFVMEKDKEEVEPGEAYLHCFDQRARLRSIVRNGKA